MTMSFEVRGSLNTEIGSTRHELLLAPSLASDNFLFLRDAILDGLGVGLVADYLVREHIASGEVVLALDEWKLSIFGNRMHLLFMPDQYRTRSVTTLIEFLTQKAKRPATSLATPRNTQTETNVSTGM